MSAPNSLAARRAKAGVALPDPPHYPPKAIILSVRLDNGDFDASVTVPLSDAANFDAYTERWLALMASALKHGVEEMNASLTPEPSP